MAGGHRRLEYFEGMTALTPRNARIDVIIPGAQKAGTSSLLDTLGRHSRVERHVGEEFPALMWGHSAIERAVTQEYRSSSEKVLRLAKSVGVMHTPSVWGELRKYNSDLRIIVMLREPVGRMYSSYWYARRTGVETLPSFERALDAEGNRSDLAPNFRYRVAYRARSDYLSPLRAAREAFGDAQIMIVVLEDYARNQSSTLAKLQEWLRLDYEPIASLAKVVNSAGEARSFKLARLLQYDGRLLRLAKVALPKRSRQWMRRSISAANTTHQPPPPIDSTLERQLRSEFESHNRALAEEFHLNLSAWE